MNINFEGLFTLLIVFGIGMVIGLASNKDKNCTVTITDMRGVQHVIKGVADE